MKNLVKKLGISGLALATAVLSGGCQTTHFANPNLSNAVKTAQYNECVSQSNNPIYIAEGLNIFSAGPKKDKAEVVYDCLKEHDANWVMYKK